MDVALATCRSLPEPDPDEQPLLDALARAGLDARSLAWDDRDADWSSAALTILRSTWNYPRHADAFLAWAERTALGSELWNPLPVLRWNHHKRYLLELDRRGVAITPTVLVSRGERRTLHSILDERGWPDAVVKPAISAASYRTTRVRRGSREQRFAGAQESVSEAVPITGTRSSATHRVGDLSSPARANCIGDAPAVADPPQLRIPPKVPRHRECK